MFFFNCAAINWIKYIVLSWIPKLSFCIILFQPKTADVVNVLVGDHISSDDSEEEDLEDDNEMTEDKVFLVKLKQFLKDYED